MKRLTALGLSLVLILAAAGCGKAEQNRQDSAAILPETADSQSQVPEDDSPANTASGSAAPGDPITDTDPPALTLPTLWDLADRYGEALSWADFAPYFSEDIGSGLYLFYYPMDWAYYLLIGGSSLESPPLYIRLVSACAPGHYIDVRYADIDQFIDSSPGIPHFPMPKCWPPIRKMPPE